MDARRQESPLHQDDPPAGGELCKFDLATKKEKSMGLKLSIRGATCSPVADKLAFTADLGNDSTQVFTCGLDGKNVRQITFGPGVNYTAQWSPNGRSIVFFRELGDGKDQVYVMSPDGSGLHRVSNASQHNFYPDFAPGGAVSYTLSTGETDKKIAIVNTRGKRLSTFPYRTSRLRWSRDGKKAIFATGEFPTMALYVSNANGSNPKRIAE
jgi:TolB protein